MDEKSETANIRRALRRAGETARCVAGLAGVALVLLSIWRCGFALARFALALNEGPWRAAKSELVALTACLGPGLALLRLVRRSVRLTAPESAILALSTSLATTGFCAWWFHVFGIWSRDVELFMVAAFIVAGIWGAAEVIRDSDLRLSKPPLPSSQGLFEFGVATFFVASLFLDALGTPYTAWDAVASWDKWAVDMGARSGFGAQLVGGYPQLLPSIHSLFYKIAGTSTSDAFPPEQLLLHKFDAVFPALLTLSLFALARRFGFSFLLALGLLAACDPFFADSVAGQADIPMVAFAAALAALIPAFGTSGPNDTPAASQAESAFPRIATVALLAFATAFAKGSGAMPLCALAIASYAVRDMRRRKEIVVAIAAGAAATLPFFAHQLWLGTHPEARETSPFLMSLPLHLAHTRLFAPNWAHACKMANRLVSHRAAVSPVFFQATALSVLGVAAAAAIVRRKTRPAALVVAAMLAFWFFTASYDWRNAYPALALGAATVAAAAHRPSRTATGRILAVALWTLAIVGGAGSGAFSVMGGAFRPWRPNRIVSDSPERRHMDSRPSGDLWYILGNEPWASHAKHIWCGSPEYRLLGERGCYSIQLNAWTDATPGDLFIGTAAQPAPPEGIGFEKIATIRRAPGFRSFWMFRPGSLPDPAVAAIDFTTDRFAPYLAPP